MTVRSLGQFCGIAKAFEIIGPRWSALVIRDLLLGPKRFADLHETMPRTSEGILGDRLDELESAGVLRRTGTGPDAVLELTGYGKELEPILLMLGVWGARSLGDPRPGDIFSMEMAILALRSTFRPDVARGLHLTFEVHFGPMVLNCRVDDGVLVVKEGALPGADLIIDSPVLKNLMAAELSPTDALWLGLADAKGNPSLLTTFVQLFHIPAAPELPDLAAAAE